MAVAIQTAPASRLGISPKLKAGAVEVLVCTTLKEGGEFPAFDFVGLLTDDDFHVVVPVTGVGVLGF